MKPRYATHAARNKRQWKHAHTRPRLQRGCSGTAFVAPEIKKAAHQAAFKKYLFKKLIRISRKLTITYNCSIAAHKIKTTCYLRSR